MGDMERALSRVCASLRDITSRIEKLEERIDTAGRSWQEDGVWVKLKNRLGWPPALRMVDVENGVYDAWTRIEVIQEELEAMSKLLADDGIAPTPVMVRGRPVGDGFPRCDVGVR